MNIKFFTLVLYLYFTCCDNKCASVLVSSPEKGHTGAGGSAEEIH